MMGLKHQSLCFMTILFLGVSEGRSQQNSKEIGYVQSISGVVYFRSVTAPMANDKQLNPETSKLWPLYEDDSLRCGPNGVVKYLLYGNASQTLTVANGKIYLHSNKSQRLLTEDQKSADEAMKRFGRLGGSRGVGGVVWSPVALEPVRAATFHVAWNIPKERELFTITLADQDGKVLWSATGIDSAVGELKTEQMLALRKILQGLPRTSTQMLTLTVMSDNQGSLSTPFSLMSEDEEQRIDTELAHVDQSQKDPLIRSLMRADILKSAHLESDLGEEYETALRLAPESLALLKSVSQHYSTVGNMKRVRDLDQQLRAATIADSTSTEPR